MKKKIFAISGSTRKNASSHLLINYIREINQDNFDIIEYPSIELLPHFNPDLEQTALPNEVVDFRKQIEQSLPVSMRKVNNLANIPLVKQAENPTKLFNYCSLSSK